MFTDLPPPDPSIEISAYTRGYSKGLAQTDDAQLVVRGEVAFGRVSVGGQWKNTTSPLGDGEAQLNLGYETEVAGVELSLQGGYHFLTGTDGPGDTQRFEFNLTATREIGAVTPRLSATFSPDDFGGTGESLYLEGGIGVKVLPRTTISANVGRRERSNNTDYTSFNAGVAYRIVPQVTVELRYYDTAQSTLGDVYQGRFVGALRLRF
jgi:outer membrane usher protein FimD/PapC